MTADVNAKFCFRDLKPGMILYEYWKITDNWRTISGEEIRISLCLSTKSLKKSFQSGIITFLYSVMWVELYSNHNSIIDIWHDCALDSSPVGRGSKFKLFDHNGNLLEKAD